MSKHRRQRPSNGPHVQIPKTIMTAPAWRSMSFGARLLWIELRGWLRNDRLNNGRQHLSCRDAARALGTKSTRSIVRWYAENEHHGFLRKTAEGFLGSDGFGIAAKYRFTDLAYGTHPPTRDYEKWESKMFVDTARRGGQKKQNPVSPRDSPRAPQGHIRKAGVGGAVCAPQGHIGELTRCAPQGHISRLPFPGVAKGKDQGSSTARAPAHAGGAGSSPAPDAKLPWSTPVLTEVTDPTEAAAIRAAATPRLPLK
jgi:hypothetical protein